MFDGPFELHVNGERMRIGAGFYAHTLLTIQQIIQHFSTEFTANNTWFVLNVSNNTRIMQNPNPFNRLNQS